MITLFRVAHHLNSITYPEFVHLCPKFGSFLGRSPYYNTLELVWIQIITLLNNSFQVPLEGFSALQGISGSQKFQIHKAYGSPEHLPSAHTW